MRNQLRQMRCCRATIDEHGIMRLDERGGSGTCQNLRVGMTVFFKIKDIIAAVSIILNRNNVTTQTIERSGIIAYIPADCHFWHAEPQGRIANTHDSCFVHKGCEFGNPFVFTADSAHWFPISVAAHLRLACRINWCNCDDTYLTGRTEIWNDPNIMIEL